MVEFLTILCILFCSLTIKRTGFLSPASFSALFSTASQQFFYWLVIDNGANAVAYGGLGFQPRDYTSVAVPVTLTYLSVVTLSLVFTWNLRSPKAADRKRILEYLANAQKKLANSFAMGILIGSIFLSAAINYVCVNILGILELPGSSIFLVLTVPFCLICVFLMIFTWDQKKPLLFVLSLLSETYCFILQFAQYSRITALSAAILALILAGRQGVAKRPRLTLGIILALLMTGVLFNFALYGRGDRGDNFVNAKQNYPLATQHLDVAVSHLFDLNLDVDYATIALSNTFQGPLLMGETFLLGPVSYPDNYKILSFDVLPGALDHFDEILDSQHRINIYTPYSAFCEAYAFGIFYFLFFLGAYGVCLRIMTRAYLTLGPFIGLLCVAPGFLPIVLFQQYPVRNGFRLLFFATLGAYLIERIVKKQALSFDHNKSGIENSSFELVPSKYTEAGTELASNK